MKNNPFIQLAIVCLLLITACSPKVQEKVDVAPPPPPPVVKNVDPNGCIKFNDLDPGKMDMITDKYNIYRDAIKVKDFEKAFPDWVDVYNVAPATNGKIDYVFRDGLKIYNARLETETNEAIRKTHIAKLLEIYDKAVKCFPEKESYYLSKQAFDFYYDYKGILSDEEIYQKLKKAVFADGNKAKVSAINPFSTLTYKLYKDEKIDVAEARENVNKINEIIQHNSTNCKGDKVCNAWTQVEQYSLTLQDAYERSKGFYTCDYFIEKFYADYEAKPNDCEVIEDTYQALRRGGCEKTVAQLVNINDAYKQHCRVPVEGHLSKSRACLEQQNYDCAIDEYNQFINSTSDKNKKAKYLNRIAKIYYSHMSDFKKAREYARKAIEQNPNLGSAYILIGKLYASSGKLCGPGTGWDSQIVTWPAIDKWNKAKQVDPSSAAEANKLIRQYSKFMPSKGDIFQRTLKEGASFRVKCWIQETTTIRAATK